MCAVYLNVVLDMFMWFVLQYRSSRNSLSNIVGRITGRVRGNQGIYMLQYNCNSVICVLDWG